MTVQEGVRRIRKSGYNPAGISAIDTFIAGLPVEDNVRANVAESIRRYMHLFLPPSRARYRAFLPARKVSAMTPEAREAMALSVGIHTCEGHQLSAHNQCLLASQANGTMPSVVGGFQQWRCLGRMVRKGEHGLSIWIPTNGAKKDESGSAEPDDLRFLMGYVFDIAQTEQIIRSNGGEEATP